MVVGEPDEIAALAPQLAEQGWLEGQRTVLIHGGSLQRPADETGLVSGANCAVAARWMALSGR